LTVAESVFGTGEAYLTDAGTALSSGDYADAAYFDALGSINELGSLQLLLEGVVASF